MESMGELLWLDGPARHGTAQMRLYSTVLQWRPLSIQQGVSGLPGKSSGPRHLKRRVHTVQADQVGT